MSTFADFISWFNKRLFLKRLFLLWAKQMLQEKYLFPCFEFSSFLFHCMLSFLCYKSGREVTLYIHYVIVVFLSFHYISFYTCLFLKEQLCTWEQEGFFYTHLLFITLFQIASNSAVSFKIKWSIKYLALQVDLTFVMSLFISM